MPTTPDDTYADAMRKVLSNLAQIGTLPDADLEFLTQLQMTITSKLREGAASQQATDQGGMALPGGGPQQGGPSPMGGAMPGLTPQGVNPDELRRVMGATGEAG